MRWQKEDIYTLLLFLPLCALFGTSFVRMFVNSFFSDETPEVWVGLANYFNVLVDPEFWSSMRFAFIWAFATVALQTLIGLGLALMMNEGFKGRDACRTIVFMPYVVMVPIVAILFEFLFGGMFGLLNFYLRVVGISVGSWYSLEYAPITITLAAVWRYAPFSMLILLAGLQGIPAELYEAAKIDGASAWRRFKHVTIPGLRDAISVAILLRIIWMFNKFDLPWNMTKGGPFGATQNLPVYAYREAFEYFNFGTTTAIGTIILLIVILVVYVHFKILAKIE